MKKEIRDSLMDHLRGIYGIVDNSLVPDLSLTEIAEKILKGGCKIIQLRVKNSTDREFLLTALRIRDMTKRYGALFIINDRLDIALLTEADGIHVGQNDIPVTHIRKHWNRIIGLSTHSIDQAVEAEGLGVDYIGFGPIFLTRTKKDVYPYTGISKIQELKKYVRIPVVAIGGINSSNMIDVIKAGADAVAMISEIVTSSDIESKVRDLIRIWRENHPF